MTIPNKGKPHASLDVELLDHRVLVRTIAECLVETVAEASRALELSPLDILILMGVAVYTSDHRPSKSILEDRGEDFAPIGFKTLALALNMDRTTLRRRLRKLDEQGLVVYEEHVGVRLSLRHVENPTAHRILSAIGMKHLRALSDIKR